MFWPNCLACGALGQELLNLYYPKGAILSQKLLNRELLNYRYLLYLFSFVKPFILTAGLSIAQSRGKD